MDLLLQVSEKELEEFPEPPVDHTDQDKPDRSNTGGTQSSNISHSCRLRLRPVQLTKLARSQQLHCTIVKNSGTGDWLLNWHPATDDWQGDWQCNWQHNQQHDWQHDQSPCTHLYIGRSNVTSHLPTFRHC